MLTFARRILGTIRNDEAGFTLIETMVAVMTGVIVVGALFTILDVALRQSTRQADLSQANQLGRLTLTKIVDPLHSACLASAFTPVQAGSSPSKLIVIDGYSEGTEFTGAATAKEGARKDIFYWTETGKKQGQLWDETLLAASGGPPTSVGGASTFTWKAGTKVMLGEKITAPTLEEEGKVLPFFKYYKYAGKSTTATNEASTTLTPAAAPEAGFSEAEAKQIAGVQVSFRQLAADGDERQGRSVNMTGQVTFALSAPSSEATIEAAPCE